MPDLDRHELIDPLERVLVVISHPDDAEFGAGATIAALRGRGARVDYVVTTDGGKGTEDPAVTSDQLAATRIAEQRAAADVLGVSEIVHLGYPDGYLTPSLELRRDIVRQIRHFRPDLVIAQNSQRRMDGNPFIAHPDHLATGEATMAAVYPAARDRLNFPELLAEGLETWKVRQVLVTGVEHPNLWVDVAEQMETALAALRCYASQIGDWETAERRVRERTAEAGGPVGLAAAQAFLSILLS
ncbi:MAG: PIG-L deacetylase family protein [Candidatus Limnocylindria bacterium]